MKKQTKKIIKQQTKKQQRNSRDTEFLTQTSSTIPDDMFILISDRL